MFRRFPPPDARELAWLAAAAGAGLLGLLPGSAGGFDPLTLLGALALIAPAAGALAAGAGVAFFPLGLAVPGLWGLALAHALARGYALEQASRAPSSPLWALCVVTGFFGAGFACGRRARDPVACAGGLLVACLALALAPTGLGLVAGGAELARAHPAAAARLLDLSPLVLVFDCAGWDWTHAQPDVYARAGVEWFQRRSFAGSLAGPAVLVVGCALALAGRSGTRSR